MARARARLAGLGLVDGVGAVAYDGEGNVGHMNTAGRCLKATEDAWRDVARAWMTWRAL